MSTALENGRNDENAYSNNLMERIISGFFADIIGVNHWFLISGILIIGIAIVCPLVPAMRNLDEE